MVVPSVAGSPGNSMIFYNKFKYPAILPAIKVRRLEWLGCVVKVDIERRVKKLLEGKSRREKRRKT
jgi:hypothetical protein